MADALLSQTIWLNRKRFPRNPTPYSLLPTPYSLLPTPYSLLPTKHHKYPVLPGVPASPLWPDS
ncbi:MAG TPA: hypothetical protein DCM28_03885 [Phycisphaerales bacterium]|nr:hypothetical protein [Phycisphaerales bacterium]